MGSIPVNPLSGERRAPHTQRHPGADTPAQTNALHGRTVLPHRDDYDHALNPDNGHTIHFDWGSSPKEIDSPVWLLRSEFRAKPDPNEWYGPPEEEVVLAELQSKLIKRPNSLLTLAEELKQVSSIQPMVTAFRSAAEMIICRLKLRRTPCRRACASSKLCNPRQS